MHEGPQSDLTASGRDSVETRLSDGVVTALESGAGPDLVILHSLLTDRASFDAVMPDLAAAHRVIRINLPGCHGATPIAPRLEAYVDFIGRAFRLANIGAGATLLGNGFGGTLALAFALNRPDSVAKLVICDAVAGFPEQGREAFRQMAAKVEQGGMGAIAEIAARRVFHGAYLTRHPEVVEERRRVLMAVDPRAFQASCRLLTEIDLTARLGEIAVPTRVICGELDEATPPALARRIAEGVPGASYVEMRGCGHCPPLEQPKEFLAVFSSSGVKSAAGKPQLARNLD